MSTVGLPPQMPLPTLPATPAQLSVTVPSPPASLSALPTGAALEAMVTSSNLKGLVEVDSALGKLVLRTTLPLAEGTRLALQVAKVGQQVQLRITALNGTAINLIGGTPSRLGATLPLPPGPSLGEAVAQSGRGAQAPGTATATPATVTTSGSKVSTAPILPERAPGISAQVVRGAPPTAGGAATGPTPAPSSGPAQLPTGAQLTVRLNSVQPPPAAQTFQVSPQTTLKPGAAPPPPPPIPLSQAGATPLTPPPTPGAQPLGTSGPQPLMTLTGTVTANTHGKQPIIATPQGLIALAVKGPMTPGTRVVLDVMAQQLPPPPTVGANAAMSTPPLTGGSGWPTIEQAVQTLSQSDPKLAQQLQQALPQASPRLAAAMMAFTHALRSGDPRSWPGEPVVKGLEKANSKLAKQLGDDLSEMANRSADASKGEWRAFTLPFSNGQEIEKIQLYVHKDPQEEENSEARPKEDGARFLIDLDLSRLGPLQMDGYVVSKSRRFDLILRTEQPMEREVRMNVLAMFNNAIDALGLTGTASFLVTQQFVRPQLSRPETAGVGLSGLVV